MSRDNQAAVLTEAEWPEPLDLEALAEREPEPPKFILADWLPCGYATLFAGHGGVGKSIIALYLAVCVAAGKPFFGRELQRRRVLYLSCEDRENILHWRLARICEHLRIDMAGLRSWLEVLDLVGRPCTLWEKDSRTGLSLTAAYGFLEARIQPMNPEQHSQVVMVDGVSDTYGGSEASRTEVKQFVNALLALVPPDDGALLLVGHVSKPTASGIATNEGYSGTTGWHNAVRARWYLYPETQHGEDERPERTGSLTLELQKSNLGRTDQSMRFAWDEDAHLFIAEGAQTEFDRHHRDRTERAGILRALKACHDQKPSVIVPAAMQGPRTAFHALVLRAELPATLRQGKAGKRRFWTCIEAMRQAGMLEEQDYKRVDRHIAVRLALTDKGMRECG